ncbi:hypothetical protein HMPREF3182_00069 [Megasphaera hutchinsoni]|uniref:Uncharacterized protein n=1 Tax=Megasphaera hutchinsoni TaxID=1588748 RepID=A0A134CLR0_9FIRM|nr:hypothetical protein HMPREF3182_00069 [Megasphaera hutchinsoni]
MFILIHHPFILHNIYTRKYTSLHKFRIYLNIMFLLYSFFCFL